MDRSEAIASLEDSAVKIIQALTALGVVAVFLRELDDEDIRLVMPDTLLVRPMLKHALAELQSREERHRC